MAARLSVTIGPITAADIDAAVELLRLTLAEDGVEPDSITGRYVVSWIGRGAPLLGASVGSRLVGYAMLERGPGPACFGTVALSVLQRHRRRGIGERLMRALLSEVRQAGEIDEVWLSVAPDNLPALALYEKLGFVDRAGSPATMFVPAMYLAMLWRPDR
jgi:[ribosomal protein S18]-alanine N-acetyltransferase